MNDRGHEVEALRLTVEALRSDLAERNQRLTVLMDAIFPKRPPEWTVEQLASLATAHREDSDTVDELEKAGADEDVPYAECVRRLRERIERLEADLRMADESQAVYGSELSEARERIAALERECASRATREETEFIVGKLAQAEQERDAIQETLAAVEHEVAIVYCHITGSRISKCNTLASVVISEADDFVQKDIDEAVKEAAERAEARAERLEKAMRQARSEDHVERMRQRIDAALAEPKEGA
ncbi:MAG TPA: hypothetical protein VFH61_13720 [Thermoleophilia bacterium]|nr:hypothetical protein [Thermoleophilia bacterium]